MLLDQKNIEVVATCKNGIQLLNTLKSVPADIVLLDINMPRLNGIEVMKEIQENHSSIKVIALSMYKQPSYINRMLSLGASSYILKEEGKEAIISAISACINNDKFVSKEVMNILRSQQQNLTQKPYLTIREKEVLLEIAKGLSSPDIATALNISIHTVKSHRKHIMEKFNTKNMSALIADAKDLGII